MRIQVKYRAAKNEKIEVSFTTSWADKNGTHTQDYDKNEIDVMCIYCPDTDKCYYVNPQECNKTFNLRLSTPKIIKKRYSLSKRLFKYAKYMDLTSPIKNAILLV